MLFKNGSSCIFGHACDDWYYHNGYNSTLYLTTRILDFKPFKFLKEVLPSVIFVTILSAALSYTTQQLLTEGVIKINRSGLCF
jgi:hypothetical protein